MEQLVIAVYEETTLNFREAEGARIRIAQTNGCLMCQGYRIADRLTEELESFDLAEAPNNGAGRGEVPTEEFYEALCGDWRASDMFSPRERLAIEYAERIAQTPIPLPYEDDFWDSLHSQFDDGEIADLSYSITTWIAGGRMAHILGADGACALQPAAGKATASS